MKSLLGTLSLLLLSSWANAGVDGGGGMTVVCKSASGEIEKVELLDVYEARLNPKLKVFQASGSLLEDYTRLTNNSLRLQGSSPFLPTAYHQEMLRNMMGLIDWHTDEKPLPFLDDQGKTPTLSSNCSLQQLAIFFDSKDRITVDEKLWRKLDTLNQAALLKHESYYYNERKFKEVTSESTRSYVRQIVSVGYTPVADGASTANSYCFARSLNSSSSFYVHRIPNDLQSEDVILQMTHVAGRKMLVKSTATFNNLIFDVKEKKDQFGNIFLVPASPSANKVLRSKIETGHRDDWEMMLKFIGEKPIELSILQSGSEISMTVLRTCGKL